jgi:hypothetical protein
MTRLLNAWGALGRDQRLAAGISLGLFVSMLLPWYSKTVIVRTRGGGAGSQTLDAFQAFSFVEAAVLLVSVGVLAMLFSRAEQRDFQLPGGDGLIVTLAGAWTAILIFYRLFDKPGLQRDQQLVSTVGLQWGIFITLLLALGLAYAGRLIRGGERGGPPLAHADAASPEPPTSTQDPDAGPLAETAVVGPSPGTPAAQRAQRRERPRYPPPPSEQMSFEDSPPRED